MRGILVLVLSPAADTDSLQSLSYSYDAGGNVLTINDYKAGGTQTQTFTYDALDRLVSAVASGGTGGTYDLQNYTYHPDTGNLASNANVNYTYGDSAHKHAVTSTSNGNSYSYDANGNQTSRRVGGTTYTLIYDAENRLVQIKRGSNIQATYTYDGDGNRVKTVVGSTTTAFVGNYLEWTGSTTTMKKYYYAGGQRVAMRQGSSTLYYLLTDHLGSTSITATSAGGFYTELRYYPWGGTRYASGTTPTSYRYTGQREAEVGLYHYGARFYDPSAGRFIQADTIIPNPGDPPSFDRYAYSRNAPTRYKDPTGHHYCDNSNADPDECPQVSLPDVKCRTDVNCYDAYLAYQQLAYIMMRLPTEAEILYMTMGSEYWSYIDYPYEGESTPRSVGREAVARQYFEFCGTDRCSPNELYTFLGGYQQWAGMAGVIDGNHAQRAQNMNTTLSNNFFGTGDELWYDVGLILDNSNGEEDIYDVGDYAVDQQWTQGSIDNEPWQFFTQTLPPGISLGWDASNYAILMIDKGDNTYLFMFTALQTEQR